jgi:hypothetical protein
MTKLLLWFCWLGRFCSSLFRDRHLARLAGRNSSRGCHGRVLILHSCKMFSLRSLICMCRVQGSPICRIGHWCRDCSCLFTGSMSELVLSVSSRAAVDIRCLCRVGFAPRSCLCACRRLPQSQRASQQQRTCHNPHTEIHAYLHEGPFQIVAIDTHWQFRDITRPNAARSHNSLSTPAANTPVDTTSEAPRAQGCGPPHAVIQTKYSSLLRQI